MSSRDLAVAIAKLPDAKLEGQTPWKTINARISEDIRNLGNKSVFLRTGHGQFGLREWEDTAEFIAPTRKLNPIDETICVIPRDQLHHYKNSPTVSRLYEIDVRALLRDTIEMVRLDAEKTTSVVQLVPTFIVRVPGSLLCYTRTKRLPEARLHNHRSLSFGGHMQADDIPELFFFDDDILSRFLCRELYEEIEFDRDPIHINFLGLLHLEANDFELQHAGLVFDVLLAPETEIQSLEPGMHTDIAFDAIDDLQQRKSDYDSWSQLLLGVLEALD